ncbi:MAG TPA: NUDIX hydrolase [Gaiellaceae bacterium]|nr:NUDIX hydrolase [Gaiellaceae bacterium]
MSWRRLDERVAYAGWRRVLARSFETPDGVRELEVKQEPDAAAVVALTPTREVVLVREFRPGPEAWLLELPGGVVDEGEEPAAAAQRELLEETGYDGEPRSVGAYVDCAYSTRVRYVFVVEGAQRIADSSEALEIVLLPLDGFRDHLRSGRLTDVAAGYLALDALGLL